MYEIAIKMEPNNPKFYNNKGVLINIIKRNCSKLFRKILGGNRYV